MHSRRILVEPGREHVVGVLERHAADVIDALAGLVVLPAMRRARRDIVVGRKRQAGGNDQIRRRHRRRGLRHHGRRHGRSRIALVHHHPADIVEHHLAALVDAGRAHPDHAAASIGIFAQAQHLGVGRQGVAGIDRYAPAKFGIAEVGDRVQRDVGHGLADHDMEHHQIVERRARQAERARKDIGRVDGEARAVKPDIQCRIGLGQRARRGVADLLPDPEILEEVAGACLAHATCSSLIAAASASARSACST